MTLLQIHAPWRIGVDVGGTFTDLVLIDSRNEVFAHKSPSVPSNPALGVLQALDGAAERLGLPVARLLGQCEHFIHGTTVATNVLLERKGAKVGLLTTHGFRDSLEIRRGYRELMWDHRTPWKEVMVPRHLRRPVGGRIDHTGAEVAALSTQDVLEAAVLFRREGVEAVAISFLHSYANDSHEREALRLLTEALPDVHITSSAALAPIIGEFERTSTAVVNAYVGPRVLPYLTQLGKELRQRGLKRDLLLVQSNGGAISLEQIAASPAALAMSGPAAGLASLKYVGDLTGNSNLISIEIGGTSCDVTVVNDGIVAEVDAISVDEALIALPSVEIHTIAIGGGTVSGVDDGGLLFVGPEGAGARPGPACYGHGGTRPTISDAQLVLGRLRAGSYAGGALTLDSSLSDAAFTSAFGQSGLSQPRDAAEAVIRLADIAIQHAIEKVSLVRGLDPSKFVLIGAGGAGALHVADVARRAGMKRAFVPRLAGVFCALGMCKADVRHDFVRTVAGQLDQDKLDGIVSRLEALEADGQARLTHEGFPEKDQHFVRQIELRYVGQQWPITLRLDDPTYSTLRARFDAEHERIYASSQEDSAIEVVNIRLAAIGRLPQHIPTASTDMPPKPAPIHSHRAVAMTGEEQPRLDVPVLYGPDLCPGHFVVGPAIVEELTTTILIGDGDRLQVDAFGNYDIEIAQPEMEDAL